MGLRSRAVRPTRGRADPALSVAGSTPEEPRARCPRPRFAASFGRPRQWVKNVLVFAAPAAAGVLGERAALFDTWSRSWLLPRGQRHLLPQRRVDVEADRPTPRSASARSPPGIVPVATARVVGVRADRCAASASAFVAGWELPVVDRRLHHLHDHLLGLAQARGRRRHRAWSRPGFVLRAIAGAVAVDVPISDWFFIVGGFGSLFMVAGKRHAEHLELGRRRAGHRATLGEYSLEYLGYVRAVASGVVMVGYCLWAFEKAHAARRRALVRALDRAVRPRDPPLRAAGRRGRGRRARGRRAAATARCR